MIVNEQTLRSIFVSFKTQFSNAFNLTVSHADKLAMFTPSVGREDDYVWLGHVPSMREWLGERVVNNPEAFSYVIRNKTFESTIAVKREDIEDDRLGVFKPMIEQLGSLSKIHPDELIFSLMKDGFRTKCYDGQYFFDTDHPVNDVSVSNVALPGPGEENNPVWYLFDTTQLVKPFIFQKRRDYAMTRMDQANTENVFMRNEFIYGVDARVNAGYGMWQFAYASYKPLTAENYAAARAAMRSFKADNGRPLHVNPSLLVVPPTLEDSARKLLIATQNSTGATNVNANTAELIVSAWLA